MTSKTIVKQSVYVPSIHHPQMYIVSVSSKLRASHYFYELTKTTMEVFFFFAVECEIG